MTIAPIQTLAPVESQCKKSRRLCRPRLAIALMILMAIQTVMATGAWEYPYAKLLMLDVIRTETGFATPPLVTVKDDYIVSIGAPPSPSDDQID